MTGERMTMAHILSTSQRSLHFGGHRASLSILQSRCGLAYALKAVEPHLSLRSWAGLQSKKNS